MYSDYKNQEAEEYINKVEECFKLVKEKVNI
jgi:hypothetical protein